MIRKFIKAHNKGYSNWMEGYIHENEGELASVLSGDRKVNIVLLLC